MQFCRILALQLVMNKRHKRECHKKMRPIPYRVYSLFPRTLDILHRPQMALQRDRKGKAHINPLTNFLNRPTLQQNSPNFRDLYPHASTASFPLIEMSNTIN